MSRRGSGTFGLLLLVSAGLIGLVGCAPGTRSDQAPGIVLVSLSGLRADALGFAGREPSVSPFLDGLAERSVVYARAVTNSPETLSAHVSLLSGLYPGEHRVAAPSGTLSADVPVLAERFASFGYRTGGFTAGGYLTSDYGFDRGFDRFEVARSGSQSPFGRALKFLGRVGDDSFFVFIHSDALEAALIGSFDLAGLVTGRERLRPVTAAEAEKRYFAALAELDREVAAFFRRIEAQGLAGRTTVVVTADHGFEFGEHGRLGHGQVYPESIAVPLLFFRPDLEPRRVETLAQTVDVAPSLYWLAGLPMPRLAGMVLPGTAASAPRLWAIATARERRSQESLLLETDGSLFQLVESRLRGEHDGTWVTRQVAFDTAAEVLDLSIVSFSEPRAVQVLVNGREWSELSVGTTWSETSLPLPEGGGARRVLLRTEGCDVPREVGAGEDGRCLSFKIRGLKLSKSELFDLRADPSARLDLYGSRPDLAATLSARLKSIRWDELPAPGTTRPRSPALAAIEARGEYPEPPHP